MDMDFNSTTALGLAAAAVTTTAFLPQVVKAWRTRHTRDLSLATLLALCLGIILWVVYGVLRSDLPLILSNAVTLMLVGTLLMLKLKYR